ncbi:MAG: glycerate kinase [Chloroflexi bacterium]|nr:MAG: glycerate kinase [Chloroflexota bacterium]
MDSTQFLTQSLQDMRIVEVLSAALDAVDPGAAVQRYLEANPLPDASRVFALGIGKAAVPMTQALAGLADLTRALIITKHASVVDFERVMVMEGNHPVPGVASLRAGREALDFVSGLQPDDLLVCLISGGGSALMTDPIVLLAELQLLTSSLLACGARIDEMNTLRRRLDRVKGGGLARATRAPILSLILSDVVGSPIEAIASGPTAPDPTTREDAIVVLEKYNLQTPVLDVIRSALETPKPDDLIFERVRNVIVGDNALAARAALVQAQREGFETEYLGSGWQGEARQVGLELGRSLVSAAESKRTPFCMVAGGETTVTIRGSGTGGRNQELALAAVPVLAGLQNVMLITLATDGEDGPTDAAGAVVTGESMQRAITMGLEPEEYLERNDSYAFFQKLGDSLRIGPTGTNVNDLVFLVGQ